MGLSNTLRFILNHPLNRKAKLQAIHRFVKWQIGSRLVSGPVAVPFVNESRLLVRPGMTGATGNNYCGLHEFEDMAFLLHFLRSDDVFADIGANVGSYTVLATGVVGADTVSVEPVPSTFQDLLNNLRINDIQDRVTALNIGVGGQTGTLRFSCSLDSTNHVVAEDENLKDTIEVPVNTLDGTIAEVAPALIKIDVEGFETEVIEGAEQTLASPKLSAIIMELNGSGKRYGYDEDALHRKVLDGGFAAFAYDPFNRQLEPVDDRATSGNTLYVRNLEQVSDRVLTAPKFSVNNVQV